MKKPIIIFRFHKEPDICLNRLELLKFYNPGIPIYGIYGGNNDDLPKYRALLRDYLYGIYAIKGDSGHWKWKNFDLVLLDWYCDIGNRIDFDRAYVVEWDLLMFGAMKDLYTDIGDRDIGLTGLMPLSRVESRWFWTSVQPHKDEWNRLLAFVTQSYQYASVPLAALGPGLCFPKSFLKAYNELYLPELCHDEIRVPLAAQLLGYPIKDTGFFKEWFSDEERKYFNLRKHPIDVQTIYNDLASDGRKVFHPFHGIFGLSNISGRKHN